MKKNRVLLAMLAACLLTQPCMTALAEEGIGPGYSTVVEEDSFGPGYMNQNSDGSGTQITPWVKTAAGYVDDAGNVIDGALLRGVSVSKWQGDVNWGKVAADDISFALIRMGSFGYEGEYTMDPTYDTNMREAKANGVHTTPYVYLQTRTVEEAKAAARYALEKAVPYDITYPLAVDVESQYILDLSKQELTDIVNAFCQVIEEAV